MADSVNNPAHYNMHPSGVECVTIASGFDYCTGNAIKYLWRAGLKGEAIEDYRKAEWYIRYKINQLENNLADSDRPSDRLRTGGEECSGDCVRIPCHMQQCTSQVCHTLRIQELRKA